MVGVVAGVDTPFAEWSMAFVARIGLAHSVVGSGGSFAGASAVTMPEGPGTDGE
jgi:hypothetical protein